MKKILLFVFMMLVLIPVHGLESNNTIRKHKYYRLNEVLGPMVFKNEVTDEFPLINENNYIEGELSELSTERPLKQDGRKIYEYDGFHYSKVLSVNKIEIKVSKGYMLSDVIIESINGKIDYENNDDNNILTSDKIVTYKLKEATDLKNLIIRCKGIGDTDKFLFTIVFKHDDKTVSEIGAGVYLEDIVIYGKNAPIRTNAYENIYSLEKLDDSNLIYRGTVKLYQYQDYKYQSYRLDRLEREYYNEYLSEPIEDYIYRDDNDYIDIIENNLFEETITNNNLITDDFIDKQSVVKKTSNDVKKNISLTPKNDVTKSSKDKSNVQLPIQYDNVLKISNKTSANKVKDKKIYYYFILVILIVLLLIALRIKNKLKECYRW